MSELIERLKKIKNLERHRDSLESRHWCKAYRDLCDEFAAAIEPVRVQACRPEDRSMLATDAGKELVRLATAEMRVELADGKRLWLWRNFVDGKPEYWAFDNPYPSHGGGDPMTLGQPCGYAIFKESTASRTDVSDDEVIADIRRALK